MPSLGSWSPVRSLAFVALVVATLIVIVPRASGLLIALGLALAVVGGVLTFARHEHRQPKRVGSV
jgi:uncharacterized membrane protein YhhN